METTRFRGWIYDALKPILMVLQILPGSAESRFFLLTTRPARSESRQAD
jgi:hypothetical protein